jgi:two-component sensor histidine kinase/ABC-type uncharacterized transport system substrate-binding protein
MPLGLRYTREGTRFQVLGLSLVWFCLLSLAGGIFPIRSPAQDKLPSILILNSYHPGYEWSDREAAGLLFRLRERFPTLDPWMEYLDAKRFPGPAQKALLLSYLAKKYAGRHLDLVITLDNPALDLAVSHRRELFPGVPIVFAGVNDFKPEMLVGERKITGVAEIQDSLGSLTIALALQPQTEEVLIIHDYTSSGLAVRRELEKSLPWLATKAKVRFTPPSTFQEVLSQLDALPEKSLGLILSFATDRLGQSLPLPESTAELCRSRVPIYADHETRLGHGIVGGSLINGWNHGERAGDLAVQVLSGIEPDTIPVDMSSTSRPRFDYRQLTRFNLPVSALPDGSGVINEPQTFYSQNKKLVWAAAGIVAGLGLVIFILGANIIRRQQAEKALVQSEGRYRNLFDHSSIPIWEEDFSAVKEFFNHLAAAGVRDFRGHFSRHPEDVAHCAGLVKILDMNQTSLDFFQARTKEELWQHLPEYFEAEAYQVFGEKVIDLAEGKTTFASEISIRTPSGEKKHLNLHLMVSPGYEETMSRVVVSFLDITQAKQAGDLLRASLREKEVLLQEVHHRVKNNLQIISSLLDLQGRNWGAKTTEELIKDCQNRVRAMALIHDSLYHSSDLGSIDFHNYLEKLIKRLLSIYGRDGRKITGQVLGDRIVLDLNQAIPCALLANELMVNCLKHAFPESGEGEIRVSLTSADKRRVLAVSDNGVGLPGNFP